MLKPQSEKAMMGDVIVALACPGRIVVTSHARPDGDALGAALALGRVLRSLGRDVTVALDRDEIGAPGVLEGTADLMPTSKAATVSPDLLICLDCGAVERLPLALRPLIGRVPVVNIDHHPTNESYGSLNWIDARSSSTGEMVWRLLRQARWPVDRATAEALWVSVVTDSGRFSYDSTRPATLRCAADLLRHGVRTAWLNDVLYGQFELPVLRLKQRAYDSLDVWENGRVSVVTLTFADFAATGCNKADADDVIEIPRALRGSQVALFFYQVGKDPRATRLSIRTRLPLDATRLACHFNGGGHLRAAGCDIPAPLDDAMRQVRAILPEFLASASS